MSVEENKAMYRRLIDEVFTQGKYAVIDEVVSPDFVEHAPLPVQATGREAPKQFAAMILSAFPNISFTVEQVVGEGDDVFARIGAKGTNTGSFMGMPPTGKQVTIEFMDLCRFSGGKVVEHWGVADNLGMMQQLGVIPVAG